jgi:hypothetical protein
MVSPKMDTLNSLFLCSFCRLLFMEIMEVAIHLGKLQTLVDLHANENTFLHVFIVVNVIARTLCPKFTHTFTHIHACTFIQYYVFVLYSHEARAPVTHGVDLVASTITRFMVI